MAIAKKCDRCGNLYENYNTASNEKKINGVYTVNIGNKRDYWGQKLIDLCPDCCEQFVNWLENKNMRPYEVQNNVMGTTVEY